MAFAAGWKDMFATKINTRDGKRQQIPYSVIKLPYEPEIGDGQVRFEPKHYSSWRADECCRCKDLQEKTASSSDFVERVIKRLVQSK